MFHSTAAFVHRFIPSSFSSPIPSVTTTPVIHRSVFNSPRSPSPSLPFSTFVPTFSSHSKSRFLASSPSFLASSINHVAHSTSKPKHHHRRTPILSSTSSSSSSSSPSDPSPPNSSSTFKGLIYAFYKFTRPHTIRGTILGAAAGVIRALIQYVLRHRESLSSSASASLAGLLSLIPWMLLPRALMGLLALLCGNAFIVGINQIYDVDIDQINKPFLPVASGEMSASTAWLIVLATLVLGLALVYGGFSPLIFGLYAFGLALGTLYSVPPFRWKQFPVAAAAIIAIVRGFLLNFGVYHATQAALGIPFAWSPPITFLAAFMTVFAMVIALAKDLPDIEGDQKGQVQTFAVRLGVKKLAAVIVALLAFDYTAAIATAILATPGTFNTPVMLMGHLVLLVALARRASRLQTHSQTDIKKFYQFIWALFYSEYVLFLFI